MEKDSRVAALDDHYYKGNLTFDQFVLGVTLAACAYLAQTLDYGMLGWNKSTLQLIPLIVLGAGAWLGFKRIELTLDLISKNARHIEVMHANPRKDPASNNKRLKGASLRTGQYYRWRNRIVFIGLASHVAVKVLITYPIFCL